MGIISLSTLYIILNSITNNMTQFDHFKNNFLEKKTMQAMFSMQEGRWISWCCQNICSSPVEEVKLL